MRLVERMWWWPAAVGLSLAGLMVGCSEKSSAAPSAAPAVAAEAVPAAQVTDADRQQAAEIFATRCTPCHGPQGMGNGPASAALTPPPRNFTDKKWQAAVTDDHIEKIIQFGGAAVGKSPGMPPNPDLVDKPVVKALRERIRSFGK